MKPLKQKLYAEFFGTFIMVFAGTSAIVVNEITGGVITHSGIALVFGLVVAAVIYSIGDISGAHINPAVTIAFWLAKRFPSNQVIPYLCSQLAGAVCASLLVYLLFLGQGDLGATTPSGTNSQSFLLEIILTFILMFTIINVVSGSKEKGLFAGAAIGSVVAMAAVFAGPISGASMNPARSFGPAIISLQIDYLWIYMIAPVIGAGLAIYCCRCVRQDCCK